MENGDFIQAGPDIWARIFTNSEVTSKLVPLKRLITLLLFFGVAGCNYPSTATSPTTDLVATAVAGTLAAGVQPTASLSADLLPHPVYFLSEQSGSAQVWRLERDGAKESQITAEAFSVESFDVSRSDGSVAYVTNNQLYLVNADGSNRRLLVDNASANPEAENYFFLERISDPLFSPDGKVLSYAMGGLWILDLATNQAIQYLTNELEKSEGVSSFIAMYAPLQWAPDGLKLVVTIGDSESSRLSFLNLREGQLLTDLDADNGITCCQVAWAPDSSSVLVASPYMGLIEPGLWRYNAKSGEENELLGFTSEGMFQFAGWPLELADGSLRYFYTSSTEIPAGDLPLFMVRSDADGQANRMQLRPDSFSNIGEVLWADDGSLALIVQLNSSADPNGSVVLAFSDERQLQILIPKAHALQWGY